MSSNPFYASKALSLRPSSYNGRNSPSNLAGFIGTRRNRPVSFQPRSSVSSLRDPGSSEEPDEGGGVGVGVKYEQQQQYNEPLGKEEDDDEEEEEEEDTMSIHSRASTPRQRPREVHFTPGRNNGSPGKPRNVLRIPDFQPIFDHEEYDAFDDETPSFSDTTVAIPNKILDNMRIPLPTPGQIVLDSPAPWGKISREKSEDSEIMEIKPEVYHAKADGGGRSGLEKVTNTELRLEVASWQEDDGDQERRGGTALSRGYELKTQNRADYDEEEPPREQEDDGVGYCHTDYDDGNEDSDYGDQKDEPDIWSEGSPTISSRGWLNHLNKDGPENLPPLPKPGMGSNFHINGKGKEKARDYDYNTSTQKLADYRTQKQNLLPFSLKSSKPRDETTEDDPQLGSREMAELAVQAAGRGHVAHNKEVAVVPGRKRNNELRRQSTPSSNDIDLTPLVPESELSTLPTYTSLLAALATIRSNNHTSIPPSQLPSELEELAQSYYPHDPRKPEKFFNKLDDKQHALAGEYILSRKRELEEKLAGVAVKRRKVVEGMKEEVEKTAEVRVVKLRRTEERREVLRGGIGKILREGGLWL